MMYISSENTNRSLCVAENLNCNIKNVENLLFINPIQGGDKNTCDPLFHQITVGNDYFNGL